MIAQRLRGRDLQSELRLVLKMTAGSSLAWWLCTLLGQPRPFFAALMPLVALSGDPFSVVSVSISRVLGVFAGVGIAIGLLHLGLELLPLVVLALLCGTLAGVALRIGDRPNIEPAFSALFLIVFASAGVLSTGVARIWETALGSAVAVLFAALVWPPDPVRELEHRLDRLRTALVDDLTAVAADLAGELGAAEAGLDDLREHSRDAMRGVFELDRARRSLRWNPLRRRDLERFADLERRIALGGRIYRHARAIARDVVDGSVASPRLAGATRELTGASDLALRGARYDEPLVRAQQLLTQDADGEELILAAQLQQLLDDLRALA